MALFLFLRRFGIVVIVVMLQLIGSLSIFAVTTLRKVDAVANVPYAGPDIQFLKLPLSHHIMTQNRSPIYLPCLVSIKDITVHSIIDFNYRPHTWLRNGAPIQLTATTRKNEFDILENGTLKIFSSNKAPGSYRCLVNGTKIDAGVLLSNETIVQNAVFKRRRTQFDFNITATIGEPVVIPCPVQSVPKANISWYFENRSINIKSYNNRFLQLNNGDLLIKNVSTSDRGEFKCVAINNYSPVKKRRHCIWQLSVNDSTDTEPKLGLLPSLQNETEYIEAGRTLQLYCTSYSEQIDWWFSPRTDREHSVLLKNSSNELILKHVTVDGDDGFYRCSTKTDYQAFNVIVTTPPVITAPLENWESSISAQASFNCHATGNPSPTITWYRNGVLLENGLRIHYTQHTLHINSIDLDEGNYQCFARNHAGEAFSSGRLKLRRIDEVANMAKRPENISCYPVDYQTIFVTFVNAAGNHVLSFVTPHMVTINPFYWKTIMPVPLPSTTNFSLTQIPILKPFVLFLRGLVPTSTQRTQHGELQTFDTTLLSEGVNCCTQGLQINTVFLSNGIFIFWTPIDGIHAKYFVIQFATNNTKNSLPFDGYIEGTNHQIDPQRTTKADIIGMLQKFPLSNKPTDSMESESRAIRSISKGSQKFQQNLKSPEKRSKSLSEGEIITELRVPGDVTGVFIRHSNNFKVRVLMMTQDNEDMMQDLKYVKWEPISLEIQKSSDYSFHLEDIEPRSATVSWNPPRATECIKVCYFINMLEANIRQNYQNTCQEIYETSSYFVIRKLLPDTIYRVNFLSCSSLQNYGTIDIRTLPDAPGPITNQKIVKDDFITLTWDPPFNPNGKILYYNIMWTSENFTHSANVSEGVGIFKFTNVTEDDKMNITIRAIGTSGIGLPIFMDLKYLRIPNCDEDSDMFSDPTFGIILGVILSLLCILIFICIFIRQRKHFKSHSCAQGSISPTESHCPPPLSASNIELREMQTLIPKTTIEAGSNNIANDSSITILPRNGMYYGENDDEAEMAENIRDFSRRICTSTPKIIRKPSTLDSLNETLLSDHSTTLNAIPLPAVVVPIAVNTTATTTVTATKPATQATITAIDLNSSSSPNFYNSRLHSNGNSTKYQNGSIKTTLPPNKHSIQAAANSEPYVVRANGSLRNAVNSIQYSPETYSNTINMDNSRHKLLDTSLDSSSSSFLSQSNDSRNYRNDNHNFHQKQRHRKHSATTNNHHQHQQQNPASSIDSRLSDNSESTAVTTVDMLDDSSIRNQSSSCNPIKSNPNNWNCRRTLIEPNG